MNFIKNKRTFHQILKTYLLLTLSSILMAISLSFFLVPNLILDGGVTGISILLSYVTNLNLAYFLVLLNLPLIYIGYKKISKKFAWNCCYCITILSICTHILENKYILTTDLTLATIFGGILIGIAVGLVIKSGAALDGTEIISILLSRKTNFSIGKIILSFNLIIYLFATFIFSLDRALYSICCYFIASKTMDLVIYYLEGFQSIWIISSVVDEVGNAIINDLGKGVTYLNGEGAYSGENKKIIFCVLSKKERKDVENLVYSIDPKAFITIANNSSVKGGFMQQINTIH